MVHLSILFTVVLVTCTSGHPHHHNQGSQLSGSSNYGSSEYQQGNLGSGGYGNNHGHGSNIGHGLGHGSSLGQGSHSGIGQGGYGGGSQHQNQYQSGSQGGGSDLSVSSGYSKKRVEGFDTGSQSVGGGSSGYQQNSGLNSGFNSGLGSGLSGSHQHGGSQFGAQSSGQKGFVVEESSGFSSVNKNQGGFQNNQHGSATGSSGGYGSSRY